MEKLYNNLNKEKRIQRKINEFGTRGPHCALCQQKDINTLITGKLNDLSGKTRSLLEEHHIAGAHQGETIIICRNCHAILTDSQLDWPNNLLDKDRSFLEKAIAFFMGLTNILHYLADLCGKFANAINDILINKQEVTPI